MNIAVVVRSLAPYTVSFFDCIAELAATDSTVTVISGKSGSEWINPWEGDLLKVQKARFVLSPFRKGRMGRETVFPTSDLWRKLSELKPTHVLLQEYSPYTVLAVLWAKMHRKMVFVATDIGPDYGPWYPPLSGTQLLVHRIVDFLVDGIVALTVSGQKKAAARKRRCLLVPHAIDSRTYVPSGSCQKDKQGVRILHVGNLIERKGVDLLIQAFAEAESICPALELRILGSGDSTPYKSLAEKCGVLEKVTFMDFMDRGALIKQYQEADIFCLATRSDTYAVAVHEAAACGLPLVISLHAGAAEVLVKNGLNGYIVDPENTRSVSDAILKIAQNSGLRRQFSLESRRIAEQWDTLANAKRFLDWL